jgi:hypothetical protein
MSNFDTPIRHKKGHATEDGGLVIETVQDVSDIMESNKAQFNAYDERSRWSNEVFGNKIASVPLTVIDDLNQKGIMRGFHVLDQKKFKEFLNHPDNRVWRTRPGRV